MKQFEPRYRLVRYGLATKIEKAARQQRTYNLSSFGSWYIVGAIFVTCWLCMVREKMETGLRITRT